MNCLYVLSSADAAGMAQALEETLSQAENLSVEEKVHVFAAFIAKYGPKILSVALVLVVGTVLLRTLAKILRASLRRSRVDPTLHSFIVGTAKIALYILLVLTCLGLMNVPITPFITALGTVGLALSLAVKDTLANMAGGISVLFSRPFSKGDSVEIGGKSGVVSEIGLVYTKIKTYDNTYIYYPNGDVAKSTVVNVSALPTRRVEVKFSIAQDNDLDFVKKVMYDVINSSDLTLHDPAPAVFMSGQISGGLFMTCQVWTSRENSALLDRYLLEETKKAFDKEGIRFR